MKVLILEGDSFFAVKVMCYLNAVGGIESHIAASNDNPSTKYSCNSSGIHVCTQETENGCLEMLCKISNQFKIVDVFTLFTC